MTKTKPSKILLFIIAIFALTTFIFGEQAIAPDSDYSDDIISDKNFYDVVDVVDGDTVKVLINGEKASIRMIGIDTPETVHPSKPVECYGIEASNKAKEVLSGKKILLESDSSQSDKDKYDRLLRYVILENGVNFNKMMVEEGYAFEYTYDSNPYKYQAEFMEAQKNARESKRGLWSDDTCGGDVNSNSS